MTLSAFFRAKQDILAVSQALRGGVWAPQWGCGPSAGSVAFVAETDDGSQGDSSPSLQKVVVKDYLTATSN